MNATKHKVIKITTEKKTDGTASTNKNVEIGSINEEKEMLIERYENVLNFLKGVQMNNAEDLAHIKKPLDDLESNLKYIPNGPFFNDVLPTEIKEDILNMGYPCDSQAFVAASVCQDWKGVLENRLKREKWIVGRICSKCEDKDLLKQGLVLIQDCVKPADFLKAATTHKLDVHLIIWRPLTEVDPKLVAEALTSASGFTISNQWKNEYNKMQILSNEQFDHLFTTLDKGNKVMEEVKLIFLDLSCLNQEILANCLVNKIKRLTLDQEYYDIRMLDVERFLSKLLQNSKDMKLTHLTLNDFTFDEDLEYLPASSRTLVARALCTVENVKLCGYTNIPLEKLLKNLCESLEKNKQPMKTLIIVIKPLIPDMYDYIGIERDYEERFFYYFGSLINPQDLKTLFSEMSTLQLEGVFTKEQQEAVSSLPDVEVGRMEFSHSNEVFQYIGKGSSEMFRKVFKMQKK